MSTNSLGGKFFPATFHSHTSKSGCIVRKNGLAFQGNAAAVDVECTCNKKTRVGLRPEKTQRNKSTESAKHGTTSAPTNFQYIRFCLSWKVPKLYFNEEAEVRGYLGITS